MIWLTWFKIIIPHLMVSIISLPLAYSFFIYYYKNILLFCELPFVVFPDITLCTQRDANNALPQYLSLVEASEYLIAGSLQPYQCSSHRSGVSSTGIPLAYSYLICRYFIHF